MSGNWSSGRASRHRSRKLRPEAHPPRAAASTGSEPGKSPRKHSLRGYSSGRKMSLAQSRAGGRLPASTSDFMALLLRKSLAPRRRGIFRRSVWAAIPPASAIATRRHRPSRSSVNAFLDEHVAVHCKPTKADDDHRPAHRYNRGLFAVRPVLVADVLRHQRMGGSGNCCCRRAFAVSRFRCASSRRWAWR